MNLHLQITKGLLGSPLLPSNLSIVKRLGGQLLARIPGFKPRFTVLETVVLPLNYILLMKGSHKNVLLGHCPNPAQFSWSGNQYIKELSLTIKDYSRTRISNPCSSQNLLASLNEHSPSYPNILSEKYVSSVEIFLKVACPVLSRNIKFSVSLSIKITV